MTNMTVATSLTPALVIYLLDVSGSMAEPCGSSTKIDTLNVALKKQIVRMVQRSTKGSVISPRYDIAMFAYSNTSQDLLSGVKNIAELVQVGVPTLTPIEMTGTAEAFAEAEKLLQSVLPKYQKCAPPLICHMTDGMYNTSDPEPIAERIKKMTVDDGNVLIENVFLTDDALVTPISDAKSWPGLTDPDQLKTNYAKQLFRMSSPLPSKYREAMAEMGYKIETGARLMLPGNNPEIIELAFALSGMTGLTPSPEITK